MPVLLIIFDLDGTLVDTSGDITNALNAAIAPLGLPALSVEETTALVGEGVTRLIEKALGPERAGHRDSALKVFLDYYTAHIVDHSAAYPHVADTLEKLNGVKKAVLSNKSTALSEKLLQKLGLHGHFDLVVGGDTAPEKKPSPRAVLHVLDSLGVEASDALMVGDSTYDVEAAREAGVRMVAVTYGYRDRSLLAGADHMIDSMDELIPLLHAGGYVSNKRSEDRHTFPDIYRKYLEIRIMDGNRSIPATALDFSERGLKMITDVYFEPGSALRCVLSAPMSLSREMEVTVRVRHCIDTGEGYITGAEIEKVESEMWFNVFRQMLRFITERHGELY